MRNVKYFERIVQTIPTLKATQNIREVAVRLRGTEMLSEIFFLSVITCSFCFQFKSSALGHNGSLFKNWEAISRI